MSIGTYILLILRLTPYILGIQYLCDGNQQQATISSSSVQTDNNYPQTIIPTNANIPVTLGVHNYIYKDEEEDPELVYHEIDVKVLDTYFNSLYIAYPAVLNSSNTQIFQSRFRDNLGDLFRIRYATYGNVSCLASNFIQFKMIFLDNNILYEYYFGNCNSSQVFYESFDSNALCIPVNFTCYQSKGCEKATYDMAYSQAIDEHVGVFDKKGKDLSVSGYYPSTSLACLDNKTCEFGRYSTGTFDISKVSYTPVIIATEVSLVPKTDTTSSDAADLLTTSLEITKNLGHSSCPQPFTSLMVIFLYILGY